MTEPREEPTPATLVRLLAGVGALALVVAYAWVCDDAFITLRTVDNFVEGRGLTWNPGERVQAYSHPLWMLALSAVYFVTREPFYTTIALSVAATAATLWLCSRWFTRGGFDAVALLLVLGLSRAFVDFSTSGLENPLSHLLVAWFAARLFQGASLRALALPAALGMLCRMDLALLFAPALAWRSVRGFRAEGRGYIKEFGRAAVLGGAPFLGWELFSLVYYGSLVPNTALAKLGHGHPLSEVLLQGCLYLLDSVGRDPLTLTAIAASLAVPAVTRKAEHAALAGGVLAYVLYVVRVGGDFMSGRFLTAPLVAAAILLAQLVAARARAALPAIAALVVLGFSAEVPTPLVSRDDEAGRATIDRSGIVDERRFYGPATSLRHASVGGERPDHKFRARAEALRGKLRPGATGAVTIEANIGILGYYAPPELTLIDNQGLADPLLARLPAVRYQAWRIGHFTRPVPPGYADSVRLGTDRFKDPNLGRLWEQVRLVTRGPLWSGERLRAIWALNTGAAARLVDVEAYRYFEAPRWPSAELGAVLADRPHRFDEPGAFVAFAGAQSAADVRLMLSPGKYEVVFRRGRVALGSAIARTTAEPRRREGPKPKAERLDLEPVLVAVPASAQGFDELQILPLEGAPPFQVEQVSLVAR